VGSRRDRAAAASWIGYSEGVMRFEQRWPPPPLDTHVKSIWYYRCEPRPFALERVLPNGAAQLIVNLKEDQTRAYDPDDPGRCHLASGAVVSGIGTRFQIIDTAEQEHVVGVSFHPGGTVAFFPEPAHTLHGPDVPLEALWGVREAARLRERLLEAPTPEGALDVMERALVGAWRARPVHPAVSFALATFLRRRDPVKVRAVCEAVGLSPKRFIDRFRSEVGLAPKQFCRVVRFQRALARAHACAPVDWTEVALACGYFDQAHFIHDFRAFSGLTPTGYRAGRTEFQNHVTFLQSPPG
jgi:AraC-like DNA-binding protein